jgi:hypothetical protein
VAGQFAQPAGSATPWLGARESPVIAASSTAPARVSAQGPFTVAAGTTLQLTPPTDAANQLCWLKIDNASPFSLLVTSPQAVLGQLGAFTSDCFPVTPGAAITATPIPNSGVAVAGADSSLYATWYDVRPLGVWPAALGAASVTATPTVLLAQQAIDLTVVALQSFTVASPPLASYHTALGIVWVPTGLGQTQLRVSVASLVGGVYATFQTDTNVVAANMLLVPISGAIAGANAAQLQITCQRDGTGALVSGTLFVFAMASPALSIAVPTQPLLSSTFQFTTSGLNTTVATGATTAIKPAAMPGTVHKLKALSWRTTAVPAAAQQINFLMGFGGPFLTTEINVVAGEHFAIALDVWVAEAIACQNLCSIGIGVSALWEVWPVTQTPG